jgi:hypothetical protein
MEGRQGKKEGGARQAQRGERKKKEKKKIRGKLREAERGKGRSDVRGGKELQEYLLRSVY